MNKKNYLLFPTYFLLSNTFKYMTIIKDFTLALIQMKVTADKAVNWNTAKRLASQAKVTKKADVIVLPECFNSPYGLDFFRPYAEPIPEPNTAATDIDPSTTAGFLSQLAKSLDVYLVGGSIPERCPASTALYNTSMIFDRTGRLLAKHRKVHLFDIQNVGPSKLTFQAST